MCVNRVSVSRTCDNRVCINRVGVNRVYVSAISRVSLLMFMPPMITPCHPLTNLVGKAHINVDLVHCRR